MGNIPCAVQSINDTQIVCTTTSSASTHHVNNNAYVLVNSIHTSIPVILCSLTSRNPEYGLGYAWEPASLTITAGDSVRWSWTGSAFTPTKQIVQVSTSACIRPRIHVHCIYLLYIHVYIYTA